MDKEIAEKLEKIGYVADDYTTYDNVRDWLYDEKKIIVTIMPCCGKKMGYDRFHLDGFYYEIASIDKNNSIFVYYNSYSKHIKDYDYKDEEESEDDELKSIKCYPTPQIALKEGVIRAIDLYKKEEHIASYYNNMPKGERKSYEEYPKYLWLMDKGGKYHSPLIKYSNHIMTPFVFYKSADFDTHNYLVQVTYKKSEYIVIKAVNSEGYTIEGYQLYEAPKVEELRYQLLDKLKDDDRVDIIGIEEILDEMKKSEK